MHCQWNELLSVLPPRLRPEVDRLGKNDAQELRLRLNHPPLLVTASRSIPLPPACTREELVFCINAASRYSPWASSSAGQGYITAPGGHRIGLCGQAVVDGVQMRGIREPTSVCIRIARDFPGIGRKLRELSGSCLLLGPPGSGKTTLLRDLIRQKSQDHDCVCVVDERGELFPPVGCFDSGDHTDVLTGCSKAAGITMLLRCMSPDWIAVDEITEQTDCKAMMDGAGCGVRFLATAHARGIDDLRKRPIYRQLAHCGLFAYAVILERNRSFRVERMVQ